MADHPTTLVVDYDDTLVGYRRFGAGGVWLPGAADGLRTLLGEGYAVTVASCRVTWGPEGLTQIVEKLEAEEFTPMLVVSEVDSAIVGKHPLLSPALLAKCPTVRLSPPAGMLGVWIGCGKPVGSLYVDDRGVEFTNDWEGVLELVHERAPVRR